jgi:hypothetical protein
LHAMQPLTNKLGPTRKQRAAYSKRYIAKGCNGL